MSKTHRRHNPLRGTLPATRRLLLQCDAQPSLTATDNLPSGVHFLEALTSGFILVNATNAGELALRSIAGMRVDVPGVRQISPMDYFGHYSLAHIERKLADIKARQAAK